jgi:hypothetical protein
MILTEGLVSASTQQRVTAIPALAYNLTAGVPRLKTLGVRYYLTAGGVAAQDAASNAGLTKVATAGPWALWQVNGSDLVSAMPVLPAVVEPTIADADWSKLSTAYYVSSQFDNVPLAQSGPTTWPRVAVGVAPPTTPVQQTQVTDVRVSADRLSFLVSTTGAPVMIKVSDYPGWTLTGADGPYRISPNYVVVVPTSRAVALSRSRGVLDWLALGLGLAGIVVVGALAGLSRRRHSTTDLTVGGIEDSRDTGHVDRESHDVAERPDRPDEVDVPLTGEADRALTSGPNPDDATTLSP